MTATPPSLVAPLPPSNDHTQRSFVSPHGYSDLFSFGGPTMPDGSQHNTYGTDGTVPESGPLPPAHPPNMNASTAEQAAARASENDSNGPQQEGGPQHDEGSSDGEEDESEDEGDERGEMDRSWYSIFEEKRDPIEDEVRFWKETTEHSALDQEHWKGRAFTDLEDPDLKPNASGCIDFTIDRFNGTRDKPNKEMVMRSETVHIGGYDWRIKFYPKGNNTDHLSVYIENVTMGATESSTSEDFASPPLPFLTSKTERPAKRRFVAAQLCVILYNPTEPRQYEQQSDAHQFTKLSPDYGWTRFTPMRRRDLGLRNHFQRAPLLQNDKLAFKAYIRVIDDPTGCLWDHSSNRYDSIIDATGLRPFSQILPILAADIVLLHFTHFRHLVCKWRQEADSPRFVSWMNILLWKMLSREKSESYGEPSDCEQGDAVVWVQRAVKALQEREGFHTAQHLLGKLDASNGAAVSGSRLPTKTHPSVQAAVDAHAQDLETPALLTLELDRHQFDREKRKWKRITNKVEIQDSIRAGDKGYKLFAFVTHCGELSSNRFNTYVRPLGPGSMWYAYTDNKVTCMTHKQAFENRCGRDYAQREKCQRTLFSLGRDRRGMQVFRDSLEVAHVLFYVRDDHTEATFSMSKEVDWEPPKYVSEGQVPSSAERLQDEASTVEEKEFRPDQATKRKSVSSSGSAYNAGCATPTHWFMDEDGDVVMNEHEDEACTKIADGTAETTASSNEPKLEFRAFDHLGCPYYSGHMLGSKYHGKGHLIALNGDEYTGQFSHGMKHGVGKMVYADTGDMYDGEWSDNQRHGGGKYTEASSGNVFDGTWKHDKKSGRFTLTGTVTEEDKGICGICYEREMDTAFYDCGHVVACNSCAHQIEDCPVCRRRIVSRLQLFGVKVSLE